MRQQKTNQTKQMVEQIIRFLDDVKVYKISDNDRLRLKEMDVNLDEVLVKVNEEILKRNTGEKIDAKFDFKSVQLVITKK